MEFRTICQFSTAWDLLQEFDGCGVDLSGVDAETLDNIKCVDDYEYFTYYVINGNMVVISDGFNVIGSDSLEKFFSETLAYCRDEMGV